MPFRMRRYRRFRLFLILLVVLIILCFFINQWFVYSPSSVDFLELNACPACFGVHLCHLFRTNHLQLTGWQRFSFFNNDMFNIKNVYYGTLNNHPVIFKKMAHQSEWKVFDDCHREGSCSHRIKPTLTSLLPCANSTFISKFQNAFITSTGFDNDESKISLETTTEINFEPIVLSGLAGSGLPIPSYYGACGRVGVVSDEGTNFVSYLHSPFQFRAFLARELLISMHQLNTDNSDMVIYYPDVNLENFVYNQHDRHVKIIDLEYVIIVERHLFSNTNLDYYYENTLNPNKYCTTYMPDFNVKQVCRYILSPSIEINGREMSSDFLHDIPENIDQELNMTNVILACAQTDSSSERLVLYEQLLKMLSDFM